MQSITNTISVRLRAMEPDDLDLLYSVENDACQWVIGNASMPFSRDILRQYILSTTGDIFTDKQVRLIIETNDGKAVGMIDLTSFDPKNRRAEVGIIILPAYRGQGFATMSLQLLETYCKATVHIHMLYAIVPDSNEASLKLFGNRGFFRVSELRDWLYDGENYGNAQIMQKII